jgi:hypothetical protein
MRIIASDGPPAENGTTTVMGWEGNLSAAEAAVVNVNSRAQAVKNDLSIMNSPNVPPSLRGAKRRSNPCLNKPGNGLLRFARNDEAAYSFA